MGPKINECVHVRKGGNRDTEKGKRDMQIETKVREQPQDK